MKITRQHMIDAVITEPLFKGAWVSDEGFFLGEQGGRADPMFIDFDDNNCPVCAVGGTLRKAGFSDESISAIGFLLIRSTDGGVTGWDPDEWSYDDDGYISDLNPLTALSCFFEGGDWKTREDLVKWIEKNIRPNLNLDIAVPGGAQK